MRLDELDFELPPELIAQHPTAQRDACRLLHLRRRDGAMAEHRFENVSTLLRPGDVLVRNVTRVIPARLHAIKEETGARCEVLLVEPATHGTWWALVRPARRLPVGARVRLQDGTRVEIAEASVSGRRRVAFPPGTDVLACARRLGAMPLPPYVQRPAAPEDVEAYQTIYAQVDGSIAAPTAGLHFTPAVFEALQARGIDCVDIVLHIGPGTFEPVRCDDPRDHVMHWERFGVTRDAWARLQTCRRAGARVVAVGTTVTRVLESVAAWENGTHATDIDIEDTGDALHGRTRLFIHSAHAWRAVDVLLTNFHLPRSTLLMLVDAFAGRARLRAAYAWAVERRFRFFSYGDAMLIE